LAAIRQVVLAAGLQFPARKHRGPLVARAWLSGITQAHQTRLVALPETQEIPEILQPQRMFLHFRAGMAVAAAAHQPQQLVARVE
jgi:hypothetical protein